MDDENLYKPLPAKVVENRLLSPDTNLLTLDLMEDGFEYEFTPGQFIELSLAGYGEIPVGLANNPGDEAIQVVVRQVGNVTRNVPRLEKDDRVGVRGPLGNGFLPEWIDGKNLLIVGGGCGMPPLRSLFLYGINNSDRFNGVTFCYGSRTKKHLLFRDEYPEWKEKADLKITVDTDQEGWGEEVGVHCNVGVVTNILSQDLIKKDTVACLCGPPIMYRFVIQELEEYGMAGEDILVSLERRMKCGVGKCQHCTVGDKYVCLDGPVFKYSDIKDVWGALD